MEDGPGKRRIDAWLSSRLRFDKIANQRNQRTRLGRWNHREMALLLGLT